jgi:hypothetical protein
MKVFLDFHTHSYFEKSLNASFKTLVLKKAGAIDISDFRPISLISAWEDPYFGQSQEEAGHSD